MKLKTLTLASVAALSASAVMADNLKVVHGGGAKESSTYSGTYVPMSIANLDAARMSGYEWGGVSEGCVDNMGKVTENPTHLALCQGDMVDSEANHAAFNYTVIRRDLGLECYYTATSQSGYENWGHVLGNAWDLTVHTAGEKSGSVGSWKRLVEIFPDLADATLVHHANDLEATKAADAAAANGESAIAWFVKRPDPKNATFEFISDNEMTVVPVVDFELEGLGYTFPDLPIENAGWGALIGGEPKRVTTACTPIVLITGVEDTLEGGQLKRFNATVKRLSEQDTALWQPEADWFADMMNNIGENGPDKIKAMMQAAKDTAGDIAGKIAN